MDKTYNIKEAAQKLGVSYRTIFNWVHAGKMPGAYKSNPWSQRRAEWVIPQAAIEYVEKMRRELAA